MILQKNEIQDIINKKSNSKNDLYISEEECLNLIETYIFYKKGIKINDIIPPTVYLKQGALGKLLGQEHLKLMHLATDIAWSYFVKELNESFTEQKD